jgi:hypothetical protein
MDFVFSFGVANYAVFGEVVVWTLPQQNATDKVVTVLDVFGSLPPRNEQDDLVVICGRNNATRDGLNTCVAPKLGKLMAGVLTTGLERVKGYGHRIGLRRNA